MAKVMTKAAVALCTSGAAGSNFGQNTGRPLTSTYGRG